MKICLSKWLQLAKFKQIGLPSRLKDQEITEMVVLSGDMFANELTFAAQEAIQNARADYHMFGGQKVVTGRWISYWLQELVLFRIVLAPVVLRFIF